LERFLLLDGWSALLLERFLLCGDGEIFWSRVKRIVAEEFFACWVEGYFGGNFCACCWVETFLGGQIFACWVERVFGAKICACWVERFVLGLAYQGKGHCV